MAFTPATLHLAKEYGGTIGCKEWIYDTIDATGDVDATGYFAGMGAPAFGHVGMEVGDRVLVRIWTTAVPVSTAAKAAATIADAGVHLVRSINATTGAVTVTAETAIVVTAGA